MRRTYTVVWVCLFGYGAANGQTPIDHSRQDFGDLLHSLRYKFDSMIAAGDTLEIFREGGDYTKFKKWESQWSLRIGHDRSFEEFMGAEQSAEAILPDRKAHVKSNQDLWHEVGPLDKPYSNIPYGLGLANQVMQPGIGPVHFITICDQDPDLMLCGSAIGGLFYRRLSTMSKWENAGSDDQWVRSPCRHAVFNVDNPDIWYAANSENLGFVRGIYRKNESDLTWDMIADPSDLGGEWNKIAQLQTDPEDADVLYAATWDGLFRSTNVNDPDPTWVKIMLPAPTDDPTYGDYTYLQWQRIHDIAIEPGNGQHLYVAVMFRGEKTVDVGGNPTLSRVEYWRLLQSFDGGSNWEVVANMPSTSWQTGQTFARNHQRINIEVSANDPDLLYVMFDQSVGTLWPSKTYRVSDVDVPASTTWTHLGDNSVVYGDGYGFGVSQTTYNDVFIGHSDRYNTFLNGTTTIFGNAHANAEQYHVDVEDFVGHPTQTGEVWMANHGGVHRSTDNGVNWEWFGEGLGVAEVYRMADSYSEPGRIALGLYHDGVVLSDAEFGPDWVPDWRQLGGADGQRPLIHPVVGNRIYWNSQHNVHSFKSEDHGVSRAALTNPGSTDWNTDWALHRKDIGVLFTHRQVPAGGQEVRRSMDNGSTWEDVSNFYALNSSMPDFRSSGVWRIYRPWAAPNQLWAHVIVRRSNDLPDIQKLYRTLDAQALAGDVMSSWEEMAFPLIQDPDDPGNPAATIPKNTGSWIADVDFDYSDPDIAWIAYSSDALGSDAHGRHMLFRMHYGLDPGDAGYQIDYTGSSDNALPNVGVGWDALVIERGSNGAVYLGTDVGVFYTNAEFLADGTEWVHLGLGLPRVRIQGLEINYQVNKIRAGLQGRGVWEHDLYCPEGDEIVESGIYATDIFLESLTFIESTAQTPSGMEVSYRGGTEVRLLPGFHAGSGSRFHAFIHPCNGQGNSFKMMPYQPSPSNDEMGWDSTTTSRLKIYPNPSAGTFTIEHLKETPVTRVDLFDVQGRAVPIIWRSANGQLLCESGVPVKSGIYMVRTVTENGQSSVGAVHIQK